MEDPDDFNRRMVRLAASTEDFGEAAQLIEEDTVRRQARHVNGRTVELLPRVADGLLAELTALGFELDLSEQGADELLAPMYLPEGWERRESDHHLYSYLVDGNGANRVLVMYKGGDYDRDAWMRFT